MMRGVCQKTISELDGTDAHLQLCFDKRNSGILKAGLCTFRQRMVDPRSEGLQEDQYTTWGS